MARAALMIVVLYALLAAYAEVVYRWHRLQDSVPPYQLQDLSRRYQPPSREHWLGTDALGRDVFGRLLQGARIAFHVGIVTSCIAIPIGTLLGLAAGFYGRRVDDAVVWLYSTFAAIPGLLFILAIAMVVGKGLTGVFLGIGLTTWVGTCRLIRAETLSHRERGYVLAARALGYSGPRIMCRHILPNVFHVALVSFTLRFPASVGTEVFMSFLGLGVQDQPSWGLMLNQSRTGLWQGAWWELASVTAAIFLLVLAFNIVGDRLRDALDPRAAEAI